MSTFDHDVKSFVKMASHEDRDLGSLASLRDEGTPVTTTKKQEQQQQRA